MRDKSMTTLQEFKNKQLEILHELDRVCNKAGINYYLAYGTCLGAVRHKGFIPWDDDIDVFLPYHEMEMLIKNKHLFQEKYFIQGRETDPNYCNMKYSLRDSSTSYFSDGEDDQDINHGMFIDLYVLYPYPDNFFKAHKLIIDSYILRLLYMKKAPAHHGIMGKISSKVCHFFYSGQKSDKKIKKIEFNLKNNGGKHFYASFFGDDITLFSCSKFPMKYFQVPKRIRFEDYLAPCPSNPEEICKLTYGKDYMKYPPIDKRVSRYVVRFMSCHEPYTKYENIYYFKQK